MVKILLVTAALFVATVLSCKCPDYTPEYGACNSEFVIQAKVTGDEKGDVTTYQLQVERVFKNNAEFDEVIWGGRTLYASTPENGACRIYLTKGELYLITGKISDGKVDVGGCDYVSVWTDLTEEQQKGFEKNFYGNCKKKEVVENVMENATANVIENEMKTEVENVVNTENSTQTQNNNTQQVQGQNSTLQSQNNTLQLQNNNNLHAQNSNTLQAQNSTIQAQNSTIQAQNSTIQAQNSTIQLQANALQLQNDTLQLQNHTLQLQSNIFKLQNNTLHLQNNTLQTQNKTKTARRYKLM